MPDQTWVETSDYVTVIGNKVYRDVNVTVPQKWVEKIRTGYMCIICYQTFEAAWPERCTQPECRFPVAKHQAEHFARKYKGVDRDLEPWEPSEPVEERAKRSGIWVPGGVDFAS